VQVITGTPVAAWAECASAKPIALQNGCNDVGKPRPAPEATAPPAIKERANGGAWGLQLIGERSQEKALSEYRDLQSRFPAILASRKAVVLARRLPGRGSATWYQVRVAEATRESAN
jgi:hypothetical protein